MHCKMLAKALLMSVKWSFKQKLYSEDLQIFTTVSTIKELSLKKAKWIFSYDGFWRRRLHDRIQTYVTAVL